MVIFLCLVLDGTVAVAAVSIIGVDFLAATGATATSIVPKTIIVVAGFCTCCLECNIRFL